MSKTKTRKVFEQTPNVYLADSLKGEWPQCEIKSNGSWALARPLGFYGFNIKQRFKVAWKVFTGEWDALKWEQQ